MNAPHTDSDPSSETLKQLFHRSRTPWWKGLNSALIAASAMVAASAEAGTFNLKGSGVWTDTATWIGGMVPANTGTDLVRAGATAEGVELSLDTATVRIASLEVAVPAAGSGLLTLTGNEDYSAVLSLGGIKTESGVRLVFAEPLTVYANNLTLNAAGGLGRVEFAGALSDPLDDTFGTIAEGSVTVAGGEVVFKGISTYAGATALQAGKLVLGGDDGLGFSSVLNVTGGILTADPFLNSTDSTGRTLNTPVSIQGNVQIGEAGADLLTLSAGVGLGGASRTLTVVGTLEIAGVITNVDPLEIAGEITNGAATLGKLVKAGDGKLILSSSNTYSGGTELQAGILLVTADDALGASPDGGPGGKLTVTSGTFQLGAEQNISGLDIKGGSIVPDPDTVLTNIGRLVVKGGSISADVAQTAEVTVVLADDPLGVPASLLKTGAGTLKLSGDNEFGGGTTLAAGTLLVGSDKALGTGTLLLAGGVLAADNVPRTLANDVLLSGTVQLGGLGAGQLTLSGTFSLNSATAVLNTASDTVLSGQLKNATTAPSGGGRLIKDGAGRLTLSAANSYTGGTELRAGTLAASANGALGSGTLQVNGGVLQLAATTQTVAGLGITQGVISGSLGGKLLVQSAAASTIEANVPVAATIAVPVGDNSAVVGLRKSGAGALTLSGASTFRGDTTIEAGEIRVSTGDTGSAGPLGAPGLGKVLLSGGSLVASGTGAASTLALDKEVRVTSSGELLANATALSLSRLTLLPSSAARVSGNITATAVEVAGRLTLSGAEPLSAVSLTASAGATFVWDKASILNGVKGIVLSGSATSDLSASKLEFSPAFLAVALRETAAAPLSGQLTRNWNAGTFIESQGTVVPPSVVVQPGGVLTLSLVPDATSKAVSLVLQRAAYQQFASGKNATAFAALLDGLPASARKTLDDLVFSPADARAVLKLADGASAFSAVTNAVPQQALAVGAALDSHLDDLSVSGAAPTSLNLAVQLNPTPGTGAADSGAAGKPWLAWTSAYGSWSQTSADASGQGKSSSSGGGGALGLERQMGDLKAGFLVSLGESVSLSDDSILRVTSEQWNVGAYGSFNLGSLTFDGSTLWGSAEQKSRRQAPGGATATARYTSQTWQAGLGVAVNLATPASSWTLSPVARLKYLNSSQDAFEETGSALAVGSAANDDSHVLSKLGVRFSKQAGSARSVAFGADGGLYWVHDFNSEGRDLSYRFAGQSQTVRTRDGSAEALQASLGIQATVSERVVLRLSGQQDLGQDRTQTTGVFSVGYRF